ncbi:MAG: bacillithiol biosynthesis cysteine-adding enzyme BshC [Cytophagales bacterium]|nr:bacillithiol biosynthesis cysteine-adding enzyme BshC [Cytophagales bacterium]
MKVQKIDFAETNTYSRLFLDYLEGVEQLRPFYTYSPYIESFEDAINAYEDKVDRGVLVEALLNQYAKIPYEDEVATNIRLLLNSDTFTVTTGHQLNIFSGPVFFVYKIVTTINLARKLRKQYPLKNFVPVYWMASEDHDFAEINHFNLFGKRYDWETEQKGAVGRFSLEGMEDVLDNLSEKIELFEFAYRKYGNLADATRFFVNELFQEEGLVIIDADDQELKRLFISYAEQDLVENKAYHLVNNTNLELSKLGYGAQVNPREINLFYLKDDLRERIVEEEGEYKVLNTDLRFTKGEILSELNQFPERFSPNVVLRPLYQQVILPNVAYVGGPGELAYWLQLADIFRDTKAVYPVIMPRNFALYISKANHKKLNKLNLDTKELFLPKETLLKEYLYKHAESEISLEKEVEEFVQLIDKLKLKVESVDASLNGFVGAQSSKMLKDFKNIEKRLKKSEEQKQTTHLKQVEALKDKLFPNGSLQERVDNYLNFVINHPTFILELYGHFDPFDFRFNIIIDE